MSVERIQAPAVVAETQALQLRALMDALGVKTGDTVVAKVTAQVSPTVARLDINGTPLEVRTPQPLPVGATLTFAVERQGQILRLVIPELPRSGAQPAPTSQPVTSAPAMPAQASVPMPRSLAVILPPPVAGALAAPPAAPVQAPVTAAAAPPAPTPGVFLAQAPPVPATAGTAQTPAQPQPVPAPAVTSQTPAAAASAPSAAPVPQAPPLASPLPTAPQAAAVPPQAVAAAVVGLVARGLVAPLAGEPEPAEAPSLPPKPEAAKPVDPVTPASRQTPREALGTAMRQAADRQESLGGLFAELASLTRGPAAPALRALPDPVVRAMATVLGFRVPAEAAATPQGLAQAVERSGTFLEARLASLPAGSPPPPDLKAALGQLKAALAQWTAASAPDKAETAPDPTLRPGVDARPQDLGAKTADRMPPDRPAPDRSSSDRALSDRPPARGALPHGQPPATPSLGRDASPADVARVLTERTEAALARVTLAQAASVPEPRDLGRPDAPVQATVEIPLRIGAETAMLQAQILREAEDEPARSKSKGPKAGAWAMRFSLEAEPIGALHALVRWQSGRVTVQLWAEREDTAAVLDAARGTLADALEASAFVVETLTITAGRPAEPREPARREPRLDRLS